MKEQEKEKMQPSKLQVRSQGSENQRSRQRSQSGVHNLKSQNQPFQFHTPQTLDTRRQTLDVGSQPPGPNLFRREGEYWTLAYGNLTCRLKDAKGFCYLALLLRHPDKEFHVTELIVAVATSQRTSPLPLSDITLSEVQAAEYNLSVTGLGDAGSVLDEQAKAAYKHRLAELQGELTEAERFHDPIRAAKIREEMDFLTDELATALGLNGRSRKAACVAERARLNVTKAIKAAIKKIDATHRALAHHLTTTIRTGTFCAYAPDPSHSISWTL
jgi:non-specific serine/threonine protein kinase